ncbi:MAG: DinB family protein [Leptospiraceae bacterium]
MTESLLDYDTWAHGRLKEHAVRLDDEQFNRDLGDGVGSIKEKLKHLHWAEEIWIRRIQGENPGADVPLADHSSPIPFFESWDSNRDKNLARLRSEVQGNPGRIVEYRNTKGQSFQQPIWQIALHLVNHGTHHRGQVSSMMRRLTGAPVPLDMILFHR